MKSLFLTSCCLFFIISLSFGQVGVRLFNYHPTGDFGFIMKPLTSLEVSYQGAFDSRLRTVISLAYLNMKPRLDTFPVYLIEGSGSSTVIHQGAQTFNQYTLLQLATGLDYAFIWKEKYSFYAGCDLIFGSVGTNYRVSYAGVSDSGSEGGSAFVGYRVRLGFEYELTNQIGVFANTTQSGFIVGKPRALLGAIDIGVGMRYSFNK